MIIGINAAAAIKQPRTGVEEYTYQLIKHLTMLPEAREHRFILFVPLDTNKANIANNYANTANKNLPQPLLKEGSRSLPLELAPYLIRGRAGEDLFGFPLPANFVIKELRWPLPFLWTQIRLAWEMLVRPPEVLFIPVHILPFFHPKNSVVTIHGLEYEYFPEYYPWLHRTYLRWSTKYALKHARKIIAVSENTKQDLIKLYGGDTSKIEVVHHGIINPPQPSFKKEGVEKDSSLFKGRLGGIFKEGEREVRRPYLLYIGRIETKKNIEGILEAYKILKEKYQIPHQLVLAGAPGYGIKNIKNQISKIKNKEDIIFTGFISEDTKWQLLKGADIFLFPSFYEGFGLPVLEAQATGVPVVTSFNSSLPEIAGEGVLFVNPKNPTQIAEAVKKIIDDQNLRDKLIQSGYENVKRFSWEKCARETLLRITNKYEYTDSS
ncbi:MAG: hypothetical protein LiPW39_32, partial [Parcubacteria group bacterium LiPW_39]